MADDGLTKDERDAVKARAKELREQAKAGKNREAGEKSVREAIDKLDGVDKELAQGLYDVVSETAPVLVPKTYYGMPGFANDEGKMVVFMQPAGKFKTRYATIGFEQPANLDDGDLWPVAWAVLKWTPANKKHFAAQVKKAIG